jgi:hypothetical protein
MFYRCTLLLLLLCCLSLPVAVLSQEADALDVPPPAETVEPQVETAPPLVVPESILLSQQSHVRISLVRDTEADATSLLFSGESFHQLGSPHLLLGTSLFDVRLRGDNVKIGWLPLSLYLAPVMSRSTFVKSGAARVTRSTETESVSVDDYCTDEVTTRRCRAQTTEAQTRVTYTDLMVYGVMTANFNHVFDWGAAPFRTENDRAGAGVRWARTHDIPDGIAYDVQHANSIGVTQPNANIEVTTYGLELTRSITGGDPTWYLTFIIGSQRQPRPSRWPKVRLDWD